MITPNDIATKDFKKVAVGYSPEEVDTFLDDIYEDYEKLYKESQKEKSKTEAVAEDTDRLKHLEKSIERTLSLAEAAAEETKAAAKADGDAIINSAKQQAEDILASARTKAYELEQKISGLESRYELMKSSCWTRARFWQKKKQRHRKQNKKQTSCGGVFLPWLVLYNAKIFRKGD